MSRLFFTVILGVLPCFQGCKGDLEKGEKEVPKEVPKQAAEQARKLLTGKWEGEVNGVPQGFEFLESGKGHYLTRMKAKQETAEGAPVKFGITFDVPRDNWLEVEQKYDKGSRRSGYQFTVSSDTITFYKADGVAGRFKRVNAFSAKLTAPAPRP
jgi:hypothetical protein